jgi:hypothetical protein
MATLNLEPTISTRYRCVRGHDVRTDGAQLRLCTACSGHATVTGVAVRCIRASCNLRDAAVGCARNTAVQPLWGGGLITRPLSLARYQTTTKTTSRHIAGIVSSVV